ncbi:MAG: hypothetical protein KatS3mg111_3188 [Pirellulaceae bacterium]|nr:MAG: hypothetical protein KatS3mg111_3188 [Pirellulaceae bacterium]
MFWSSFDQRSIRAEAVVCSSSSFPKTLIRQDAVSDLDAPQRSVDRGTRDAAPQGPPTGPHAMAETVPPVGLDAVVLDIRQRRSLGPPNRATRLPSGRRFEVAPETPSPYRTFILRGILRLESANTG